MPQIESIYFIHHSHTDVGYTADQPIVWDLHTRFIDEALLLAEKHADKDSDGAFKWTVETTYVLKKWLDHATDKDIERFQAMEKAGRIEVTGMFANLTPLFDTDQLIETFSLLQMLRKDYGFSIESAMNCDVNGENWPLVDVLLDMGIEGFTMAINTHFGGALDPRPLPFLWEGPSGRTIKINNGWTYDKGWREGIGRDAEDLENVRWPRLQAYLDEIGYPIPILQLQSFHPYGDNGSAFDFTEFIDTWNAAGKTPRIIMATPRMWWQAVEAYRDQLPTLRGDWTDFWNFGCGSSAYEQMTNRESRSRLRSADALNAALNAVDESGGRWAKHTFDRYRRAAWDALHLWDEHTWGADLSILDAASADAAAQWSHKANYAYTARSLSLMLQRDALADLTRNIQRENTDDILVFNPLPWARTLNGDVPYFVSYPRGVASDTTAGRHHQDRHALIRDVWTDKPHFQLPPTEVPAFGYTVVPRTSLIERDWEPLYTEDAVVETHRYRLSFDLDNGGIVGLYDKELDWQLVDADANYRFNAFVYEMVADTDHPEPRKLMFQQHWHVDLAEIPPGWQKGWRAHRETSQRVVSHKVYRNHTATVVEQTVEAPGIDGLLMQRVILPNEAGYIEFEAQWNMTNTEHPEATYFAFPFNVPDATARYDVGGQAVWAGEEQLPGVCRDYFTVQGWVDFSNGDRGVTIATPENPMVQLGDFHFGHYQQNFELDRAMLLGWVTNNYWETNFRAHQPGRIRSRYRVQPYAGAFDETRAHRIGQEAMNPTPIFQHLGEETVENLALPSSGSLLTLLEPPIVVLRVKAAEDGDGIIVRLLNASPTEQQAEVGSALLQITSASACDLLENVTDTLTVTEGSVSVRIPSRRVAVLRLKTE